MIPSQFRKNKVIFVVLVTFGFLMIFFLNEISRRDAVVQKLGECCDRFIKVAY